MNKLARIALLTLFAGMGLSLHAFAYPDSASAHKACDPKGVQYDAKNKQFCCGTKGGCPNALQASGGARIVQPARRVDECASTAGTAIKACASAKN